MQQSFEIETLSKISSNCEGSSAATTTERKKEKGWKRFVDFFLFWREIIWSIWMDLDTFVLRTITLVPLLVCSMFIPFNFFLFFFFRTFSLLDTILFLNETNLLGFLRAIIILALKWCSQVIWPLYLFAYRCRLWVREGETDSCTHRPILPGRRNPKSECTRIKLNESLLKWEREKK